jgi:hypothetical protein
MISCSGIYTTASCVSKDSDFEGRRRLCDLAREGINIESEPCDMQIEILFELLYLYT